MKLIDADKLCMYMSDLQLSNTPDERDSDDVQKEMKSNYEFLGFLIKIIDEQPTAYDVDAVVEQLEDMHDTSNGLRETGNHVEYYSGVGNALQDAIAIVKEGGKHEI